MMSSTTSDRVRPLVGRGGMLLSGVSALSLCVFVAGTPAYAQAANQTTNNQTVKGAGQTTSSASSTNPNAGQGGAIIVTGIRQSLRSAQNIKRNSDTVEDVITSQDIGALPDRSVTEALQRVPGVAMTRFAGTSDPDHFSVEGSGITIRGLTFVASEFNGRDTFSTGVYGQAINFQDVPAELLGSVEVFKEETADRLEGGLSGTVNMNLRLPFDNKGLHVGYDVEADYGDFSKKWSPVGSLLVSDNWDTGIGRIGILGAVSYSRLFSRADGMAVSNFQTRDGNYALLLNTGPNGTPVCRNPLPTNSDTQGFPPGIAPDGTSSFGTPCYGAAPAGANGFADWADLRYAPIGGQFRTQQYDRIRRGYAGAFQWQSLDRRALLTASFLRSHSTESWGEHVFETGSDLSEYNTYPLGCLPNSYGPGFNGSGNPIATGGSTAAVCPMGQFQNYQYDNQGVFQKGYITEPTGGWRGAPWQGASWANPAIQVVGDRVPAGGEQTTLNNRQVHDSNIVQDQSVNFKFSPTPHWDINLDAQYVKASHDNLDFEIVGSNFVEQELNLTGQYPSATLHKPHQLGVTWGAPSPALANASDYEYFTNPRYTFWRSAMDHIEHSRGHQWAFQGDVAYNFLSGGFLDQLKFGARYADREQNIKYTTYNWGDLSEVWTTAVFMDQIGAPQGKISQYTFPNFFRGETTAPPPAWYYNGVLNSPSGYAQAVQFAQYIQTHGGNTNGWVPLAQRSCAIDGTPFCPQDIQPVGQKTDDAYAMLKFGNDEPIFGNVRLKGNIGVRFVRDDLTSKGGVGLSQQLLGISEPYSVRCALPVAQPGEPPPTPSAFCRQVTAAQYAQLQQFAGQTFTFISNTAVDKYSYWLPSANLAFSFSHDLIFRLAASRDFARPSLADIRNFLTLGLDQNGNVTASAGNPFLKPMTSDNADATLEWYFGGNRVGSLVFDVFAKNIHNYIYHNTTQRSITNNGITETVYVSGPANYSGTGKVRGFELAYQQTYDFLPGLLSGFGLSANFTHLTSKGIPNSFLNTNGTPPIGFVSNLPLALLSKNTINIEPFYEKGPLSVRVAYNWRSRYLLTESDVIQPYFPIWQAPEGTLDASVFYSLTPTLKVGIQATNLTNTVTETLQQFTQSGMKGPRSYFMNDRRFAFILRGTF